MKKTIIVILLFTSLCLMAQNVPQTIDYQGRLADSSGNYLNEVVSVDFLIYDSETGGTLLWAEIQDVSCANGVFHVLLGSIVSFPTTLFDSADRWLELVVSSETLTPRTAIASVPYSLKAEDSHLLNGLNSTDFMPATTDNWVDATGDTMTGQLIVQDFVGIGTPNPRRTLTVNSTGSDPIQWQVNSSIVGQLGSNGSGAGGLYLYDNGPIAAKVTANGDSYFNGGNVGIGTSTPTSELTVAGTIESTTGGVKFPDGTTQITAATTSPHYIGENYGGGIIFWLDASGQHGLIAATFDQSTGIQWYNGSYTNTTAFASSVGGGHGNTSMIVFNQEAGTYAAKLCYDLNTGGFTDWYLPSIYELNLMYNNIGQGNLLGLGNVGGFAGNYYWSSTEYNHIVALGQDFGTSWQYTSNKSPAYSVRAIRAF